MRLHGLISRLTQAYECVNVNTSHYSCVIKSPSVGVTGQDIRWIHAFFPTAPLKTCDINFHSNASCNILIDRISARPRRSHHCSFGFLHLRNVFSPSRGRYGRPVLMYGRGKLNVKVWTQFYHP